MKNKIVAPIAYSISLILCSTLLSCIIVVSTGPFFKDPEKWEAFALSGVFFGLPAIIILGALSGIIFKWYVDAPSTKGRVLRYLINLVSIIFLWLMVVLIA